MTTRTALGTAQKLHLDRAARTAGEAFAFDEPDMTPAAGRSPWTNALWLAMAVVAIVALWYSV